MAGAALAPVLGHIYQLAGRPEDAGVSDGELLRRLAQHQDQAAFEAIIRRHGPLVWRVCRRTAAHADLAEDAFQATFMVLARRAAAVRKPAALASWLHGVAYRIARRAREGAGRCPSGALTGVPGVGPDPAHAAAWREVGAILEEEVQRLPERLRVPLLLCYWEGQSNEEAARRLGWPCGTVKTRLARARRLLHTRLVRRGVVLPAGVVTLLLAPAPGQALLPPLARAFSARTTAGASARVAALAEGLLPAVSGSRLPPVFGLLLALITATGAGGLALLAAPAKPLPNLPAAAVLEKPVQEPAPAPRPQDPLPEGAVARLGTGRFRHSSYVLAVAFSPDGKTLASSGDDATVRLWDAGTGKQLRVFSLWNYVASVAFTPDGRTLMAAESMHEKGIRLLDTATGAERLVERAPGNTGQPAALSPDGKVVAGITGLDQLALWDATSGRQRGVLGGFGRIKHLAFSPDGKILAFSGEGADVRLWDVRRQKPLHVLTPQDDWVSPVLFSADGKWLLTGGGGCDRKDGNPVRYRDGCVRIWDVATGRPLRALRDPSFWEGVQSLAITPDGRTLAVGATGGVTLWDLGSGKWLRSLGKGRWRYGTTPCLAFSPDGKLLAGCFGSSVYLWETASGRLLTPRPDEAASAISSLAVARDGRLLAALDGDGTVGLWDLAAGRLLRRLFDARGPGYRQMALSPDGKTLAALLPDGTLDLWDAAGSRRRLTPPGEPSDEAYMPYLAFSPDGTHLASTHRLNPPAAAPWAVRIWDPAAGKFLQALPIGPALLSGVDRVVFSADNRRLAATTVSQTYRWRLDGDKYVAEGVIGHTPDRRNLGYWLNGLQAVTDPIQHGITLWDLNTGKQVLTLADPNGLGRRLAFSPDGRYVASGAPPLFWGVGKEARDHTLRLYELASGQEVLRRELPADAFVESVAFAADSRTLVTGLTDSTIVVWDLFAALRGPHSLPAAWEELADADGRRAHRALASLVRVGDRAVGWLGRHLEPARRPDPARLARLLADLDSDRFDVRKKANDELAALGELARPALERARARGPSAEAHRRIEDLLGVIDSTVPSAETLGRARAVAVLEHIGTPSARRLLSQLAGGAPEARLTQEAKAALRRLSERAAP